MGFELAGLVFKVYTQKRTALITLAGDVVNSAGLLHVPLREKGGLSNDVHKK
jgi:hypothetical protein